MPKNSSKEGSTPDESVCDICGTSPIAIQITQAENDEVQVISLCFSCAQKQGIELDLLKEGGPLANLVAGMGMGEEKGGKKGKGKTKEKGIPWPRATGRCHGCGMTASMLKKFGRFGCRLCYDHFSDDRLRLLLRQMHGFSKHVGKIPAPANDPRSWNLASRITTLRRSLDTAIEAEDFERAAMLRDQLRALDAS
jgi:protein arginine kinase activator